MTTILREARWVSILKPSCGCSLTYPVSPFTFTVNSTWSNDAFYVNVKALFLKSISTFYFLVAILFFFFLHTHTQKYICSLVAKKRKENLMIYFKWFMTIYRTLYGLFSHSLSCRKIFFIYFINKKHLILKEKKS